LLKQKVAQKVTIILGYFILSKNYNESPKVAQLAKKLPNLVTLKLNYEELQMTTKKVLIVLISDFIIYSSLGSFYIPCFVMIFLYGRIFKVTQTKACSKLESSSLTFPI
jgi:hypothetical protein